MGIRYVPAIDGLRAVAVLAVVGFHAGLPAGFVGVDVFFVISGYLITRLLAQDDDLLHFYARRARRILPAAALVVVTTLALSYALLPEPGGVAMSAAAASVFVANLHFQGITGGYWAESSASMPLLHLWSLSVEEQFYLFWPLVLMFARGPRMLWAVVALSFASYVALLYFDPNAAFYQTPARAWELAAGGLVAMGAIRPLRGGLALVLIACALPLPAGIASPLSVIGATMLLARLHGGARMRLLEARPLVWIGLISYSLYLWHWPLLALDRALRAGESPLAVRLVLVAMAFGLAVLTYRYVEQPVRRAKVRHGRAVVAGVVCVVALSGTAFALARNTPVRPSPMVVPMEALPCDAAQLQPMHCVKQGPLVALWGDSFTDAWATHALRTARQHGMPAVRLAIPSCPPHLVATSSRSASHATEECRKRTEQHFAWLRSHEIDTLIVAARWMHLLEEHPDAAEGVMAWARDLPKVRRIIVIGATPEVRDSVEKCIALRLSCDIPRKRFDADAAATNALMRRLDALPNVETWDVGAWMCDANSCPGVRNGIALYHTDNFHVSVDAAEAYVREMQAP